MSPNFYHMTDDLLVKYLLGEATPEERVQVEAWLAGGDLPTAWPGLEALAPARSRKGRHGAILLPFRTLLAAIEEAE